MDEREDREPTGRKARAVHSSERALEGLTRQAYAGIRQMLFLDEIAPGQKLRYREIAERLGMSPTPVVQAMKWLEFQGLVEHEPNRGFYLSSVRPEEIREIYELRESIEVACLPRAVERLDEEGIERLRAALENHQQATRDRHLKRRLLADIEYHMTLTGLAGGDIRVRMVGNLFDLLYLKYRGELLFSRLMEDVADEHRQIFDHVVARDAEAAQKALSEHLRRIRDHVLEGLRRSAEEREALGTGFSVFGSR
ncbi:MAG: GntR family transcriptional regulator [Deltaproteobacteria bacterium]|nr:GntR family transcriptional regulator [Deltaproteobacteria bacterium]